MLWVMIDELIDILTDSLIDSLIGGCGQHYERWSVQHSYNSGSCVVVVVVVVC